MSPISVIRSRTVVLPANNIDTGLGLNRAMLFLARPQRCGAPPPE